MYFWTKEQLSILKREYPFGNIEKIINETGKKRSAVIAQAKRLKIFIKPKIKLWENKIPLLQKAYLAGHFDGEGCVMFRKKDNRLTRTPIVVVAVCNKETLELYHKFFNGVLKEKNNKNGNKKMYCWRCSKYDDLYNFIVSVLPYSIEKKEQLLLVKDFIDLRMKEHKTISFSNEFRSKAIELHEQCTQLKKLG